MTMDLFRHLRIHTKTKKTKEVKNTGTYIDKLKKGIQIDGNRMKFNDLVEGRITKSHSWFALVIQEGKNREVRKLWNALGYEVSRLKRVRYANIFLPSTLKQGSYKELSQKEIDNLIKNLS